MSIWAQLPRIVDHFLKDVMRLEMFLVTQTHYVLHFDFLLKRNICSLCAADLFSETQDYWTAQPPFQKFLQPWQRNISCSFTCNKCARRSERCWAFQFRERPTIATGQERPHVFSVKHFKSSTKLDMAFVAFIRRLGYLLPAREDDISLKALSAMTKIVIIVLIFSC